MPFEKTFHVSRAHLDSNGHMANTTYLDEVDYYRELHMLQAMRVNFMLAGVSDDASRFRIVNEIRREDGELAARVTSQGGWFDLGASKLVAPPEKLADALRGLDRTAEFETLSSS